MKSIENFENLFFEMSKWCHWLWVSPHVRMEQKLSFPECKPPITNSEPGHNLFSLRLLSVLTVEYFVEQLLPGLVSSSHWLRNILTIIIIPPAACIAETAVWRQDLSFGPRNINLWEAMANGQCFHKNLTTDISEFRVTIVIESSLTLSPSSIFVMMDVALGSVSLFLDNSVDYLDRKLHRPKCLSWSQDQVLGKLIIVVWWK